MNEDGFKAMVAQAQKTIQSMVGGEAPSLDAETEGESGGGMVRIKLNGSGRISHVEIDPLLLEKDHVHHLEQLLIGACNSALDKYKDAVASKAMEQVTKNLPSMSDFQSSMDSILKSLK